MTTGSSFIIFRLIFLDTVVKPRDDRMGFTDPRKQHSHGMT
ncbi:MAG TPA: palindromic element RPE4 domain-containing protein [Rickettsia endosymbiont of Pyrocoelia pectoralis]|nr:palindromic element RPE4 domain-containing protein [Rickettsia endosymbiont of Pyrocoelia pectoralis]